MNLFERRGFQQFLRAVAKNPLVRWAVVEPLPVGVHHRDHIGRILADQPKELLAANQLLTNSVNLQLLVNRINVEQQDQADQPSYGQINVQRVEVLDMLVQHRSDERRDAGREQECYQDCEKPENPLAPLN